MLKDNFFTILAIQAAPNLVQATLQINPTHAIFGGHFPDLPIVPGVCLMQMIKETMEEALNERMVLKKADNLKFLAVVNPNEVQDLQANIKYTHQANGISVDAQLTNATTTYFKMKATLVVL